LKRKPTAILSSSDQLALVVLAAVEELGLSVPEDLSVVRFDDIPPSAVQFG
jgi:LacI family transcriptional regulator